MNTKEFVAECNKVGTPEAQALAVLAVESEPVGTQYRYQVRHRAAGLCHLCSAKATRGRLCAEHADAQAERRRKKGFGVATCKLCKKKGHYQKTCPERKP